MISELFSIVAPVFICAGIGFGWARVGGPFPNDVVRNLIVFFGTPCLIFSTLTTKQLDPETIGIMAAAAFVAMLCFMVLSGLVLKAAGLSLRGFLPPLMFPNSGNMGLPLALFAFGDTGLALAITYFFVISTSQFTLGIGIASGSVMLGQVVRSPIIYTVAAALVFVFVEAQPPDWLANTTRILGGMTIPLLLITLGNSLARLRVHGLKRSLALALLRLGMGFAVGLGLAEALELEGAARGVLILQSTMPAAVFTYIFAEQYKTVPEDVAGVVVISTALSFVGLPLLLLYVLQ